MVVGDHRIHTDRQKVSLSELNAVAVEDRRKQCVDVPVQPFPHPLACRRIGSLEPVERLGQMLDNGRRLEVDSTVVDQHRDLAPAGKRQKLRCLVHPLLEADIAEREWRTRQAQRQRHLVGRQRMRTSVEREALHRTAPNRNFKALDSIFPDLLPADAARAHAHHPTGNAPLMLSASDGQHSCHRSGMLAAKLSFRIKRSLRA